MRRVDDDEYFFITYDNIIRNPYSYIMHQLVNNEEYSSYKDFIHTEKLENKSIAEISEIISMNPIKNPLEYYSKDEFDYNLSLAELYLSMDNVYSESPLLKFGIALGIILKQQFTKKVYIYSKEFDPRIDEDIRKQFGGSKKIVYINGDLIEVVKSIDKITTFIIDDIDMVQRLIDSDLVSYTNILLANYGYNYKLSDIIIDESYGREVILKIDNLHELMNTKVFKLKVFDPVKIVDSGDK